MKLICTDIDRCGFSSSIDELEVKEHNNRCPICFGLAIEINDKHFPLLHEAEEPENNQRDDVLLATIYNLINNLDLDKEDGS